MIFKEDIFQLSITSMMLQASLLNAKCSAICKNGNRCTHTLKSGSVIYCGTHDPERENIRRNKPPSPKCILLCGRNALVSVTKNGLCRPCFALSNIQKPSRRVICSFPSCKDGATNEGRCFSHYSNFDLSEALMKEIERDANEKKNLLSQEVKKVYFDENDVSRKASHECIRIMENCSDKKNILIVGEVQIGKQAVMDYVASYFSILHSRGSIILTSERKDGAIQASKSYKTRFQKSGDLVIEGLKKVVSEEDIKSRYPNLFLKNKGVIVLDDKTKGNGPIMEEISNVINGTSAKIVMVLANKHSMTILKDICLKIDARIVDIKANLIEDESDSTLSNESGFGVGLYNLREFFHHEIGVTASPAEHFVNTGNGEDILRNTHLGKHIITIDTPIDYVGLKDLKHVEIPKALKKEKVPKHFIDMITMRTGEIGNIVNITTKDSDGVETTKYVHHPVVYLYKCSDRTDDHEDMARLIRNEVEDCGSIIYNGNGCKVSHPQMVEGSKHTFDINGVQTEKTVVNKILCIKGIQESMSFMKEYNRYVIISGIMAGRQMNFTDTEYETSITEQYMFSSSSSHTTSMYQALRILGRKGSCKNQIEYTLHCTLSDYENIGNSHRVITAYIKEAKTKPESHIEHTINNKIFNTEDAPKKNLSSGFKCSRVKKSKTAQKLEPLTEEIEIDTSEEIEIDTSEEITFATFYVGIHGLTDREVETLNFIKEFYSEGNYSGWVQRTKVAEYMRRAGCGTNEQIHSKLQRVQARSSVERESSNVVAFKKAKDGKHWKVRCL
jgi:hypothetical protein